MSIYYFSGSLLLFNRGHLLFRVDAMGCSFLSLLLYHFFIQVVGAELMVYIVGEFFRVGAKEHWHNDNDECYKYVNHSEKMHAELLISIGTRKVIVQVVAEDEP
jgi:hypothetical protein